MPETVEKRRFAVAVAADAARDLRELLAPACTRIKIVGSVGRFDPHHPSRWPADVGDIELLAVPKANDAGTRGRGDAGKDQELFRLVAEVQRPKKNAQPADELEQRIARLLRCDAIAFDPQQKRNGPRLKRLLFRGIPVDLFICRPPADWGVLATIRLGPQEWSHALVKKREWGGLMPAGYRVQDGRLWCVSGGYPITHRPCPEEGHFFQAVGVPWVQPCERTPARLAELLQEFSSRRAQFWRA